MVPLHPSCKLYLGETEVFYLANGEAASTVIDSPPKSLLLAGNEGIPRGSPAPWASGGACPCFLSRLPFWYCGAWDKKACIWAVEDGKLTYGRSGILCCEAQEDPVRARHPDHALLLRCTISEADSAGWVRYHIHEWLRYVGCFSCPACERCPSHDH